MSRSPYILGDRTLEFSKGVLSFCASIKVTVVTRPLIDQLVRSATSIGANYAEANNAASRQDFRNKIFIAKKEAAETKYWLSLIASYSARDKDAEYLSNECQHILMTLQKIINTLREQKTDNAK